ncbi:alpha/beta hydrolase [Kineococcus indalonis]|uniref:alpha/beta hydrolase n=1 Tax=Kineococcus indalonis TaxID=2696566 RepID=UPI00141337AA|nr:alpha/beta hydrolase [Kineococcus indalonis]NAZ85123.1 alpha/beta fold hydrolase [Kineococcus indalonis]
MRRPVPALATAAAALLLGGCSLLTGGAPDPVPVGTAAPAASEPAARADLAAFYGQRPEWVDCSGGFQCARLTVPVDHADPAGATTSLALVRLPTSATGADRLGSIVLNPGGPGGSGVEYARAAASVLSEDVREHFDVVGFDPRGVGGSDPLRCLDAAGVDELVAADATPDDAAEVRRLRALTSGLGRGCAASGELAAHVDSRTVVQDLDVLRAALGDDKLTYLGKSYGTYLGALYAERFPHRVGRLVLDGAIDPALSDEQVAAGQAGGFEVALRAYVQGCGQEDDCPLPADPDAAVARVRALLEGLDAQPLPTASGRPLTQGLGYYALAQPLYAPSLWPRLTAALRSALAGDGTGLLALADAYAHRRPDGTYADNAVQALPAVNCLDRTEARTAEEVAASVPRYEAASPTFGAFLAWSALTCVDWPIPPVGRAAPVRAAGAAPVLVVGTTRDPATPYEWARGLAGQLEPGHLLTHDGDGHTAYRMGSSCVDDAVDAYLLAGHLPEPDVRC